MAAPEANLTIGACEVRVLGTIAGFVPDGDRVSTAVDGMEAVGLGIPPEDLAGLAMLADADDPAALIDSSDPLPEALDEPAGAPGTEAIHMVRKHSNERVRRAAAMESEQPFVDLDPTQRRLLELLEGFGPTRVPSPDLDVAFRWCRDHDIRLEALDMDDETHSSLYVKHVGFRHAWKSGRVLGRLVKQEFEAADAYDLMRQWDRFANQQKPLQAVEAAREAHMATSIRALASDRRRVLAIVPAPRYPGVVSHLQSAPS